MPEDNATSPLQATPPQVAACDAPMAKVFGPARSGKTESLVLRCAHLLDDGVEPGSILVETSSAFAAQAFRDRLRRCAGEAAGGVDVLPSQQVCVNVLSTPAAHAATRRTPRLLNGAEYLFLLEDIKTLGQKNRRMRTMLRFFYRQWANLEPEDAWALAGEETDLLAFVRKFLVARGAMLPEEAAFVAATYLQSDEGAKARHAYRYVLCDDFQNMSRAEQTVMCLLATDQLVVAGNVRQTVAVRTAYPCPEGFERFEQLRHGVHTFALDGMHGNADVAAFCRALGTHGDMAALRNAPDEPVPAGVDGTAMQMASAGQDAYLHGVVAVKWDTPEDELNNATKYLRWVANSRSEGTFADLTVLVPNKRWARIVGKMLKKRGLPFNMAGTLPGLGGDPRDTEHCKALVAYTKLNLLADPEDMVAWRSWCGFGNYLTNSDAWARLTDYAEANELGLYDALVQAAQQPEEPFLRASALTEPFKEGLEFIQKNQKRKGFALLGSIGASGLAEFAAVEQELAGDETAAQVFAATRQAIADPVFPEKLNAVRVMTPANLTGLETKAMFVLGAVDGFFPTRDAFEVVSTDEDRDRVLNDDRRAFHNAICKADELLVVSHFRKADLELAEQTKMQVARVKSEHGQRIALLRPSQFISEADSQLRTTAGGQQLLAELSLD